MFFVCLPEGILEFPKIGVALNHPIPRWDFPEQKPSSELGYPYDELERQERQIQKQQAREEELEPSRHR